MKSIRYMDLDCIELSSPYLTLLVTQSAGPRVLGLRLRNDIPWDSSDALCQNLMAELSDVVTETPQYGTYHFYGGHRLWLSPETFERTYIPDDGPVGITEEDGSFTFTQPADPHYGIQKSIQIRLAADTAQVELVHTIVNGGDQPLTGAAWTITQLQAGGTAILPQVQEDTGFLPNRSLALWPYTDLRSPHIHWGNRYHFVTSDMQSGMLKIGFPNPRGWLAYWLDGVLFVKRAAYDPSAAYYDFGSSHECYCSPRFLELETLSGMTALAPGESLDHTETWDLYPQADFRMDEDWVQDLTETLGLDGKKKDL
jgi:hypothetical protein